MHREFIQKLTNLVEANLANEKYGPDDLSREVGLSHTHLNRKLKSISNQNISQFIREVRLKKARELLLNGDLTIAEISYRVGFSYPPYFNRCFHKYFGVAPGEIRNGSSEIEPEEQLLEPIPGKRKPSKIMIGLIVGLIVLIAFSVFLINKGSKTEIEEKSIAVLPFANYSPKEGTNYIVNGLQEEILDKLEKIKDLKVKSRTDVEKYKDTKLSISQIAKELKVNYILEGSGQKIGDNIRIRLQLIEAASGNHLWSKPYEEEVNDETIFDIQEEVALSVANELGVVILPKEKALVIKKPTQNPEAYTLYLRGLDFLNINNYKYPNVIGDVPEALQAKQCFEQAVKLDSAFPEAYIRISHIYKDILYYTTWDWQLRQQYLDSGMMMIERAFLYDTTSNWAYSLRGSYYYRKGMLEKANEDFDKAFEISNKNEYTIYYTRFSQFFESDDYVNALIYFYQGKELQPKDQLMQPKLLLNVAKCLSLLGYPEISQKYHEEFLKQTSDSINYYNHKSMLSFETGDFKSAVNYASKAIKIDSTDRPQYRLAKTYLFLKNYSEAYKYTIEIENRLRNEGKEFTPECYFGYIYLKNGQLNKANYHFDGHLKFFLNSVKSNGPDAQGFYSQFYLACIFAARGEKEKAMENLKLLKNRKTNYTWLVTYVKYFPLLDNIRDEPEFADILKDVEVKYKKEHERAGRLLKENGEDVSD